MATAFLAVNSASADIDELLTGCGDTPDLLICKVVAHLERDTKSFKEAVEDGRLSVLNAEDFLQIVLRLGLAEGELVRAIELSDKVGAPPITVVADPLPTIRLDELPVPEELDVDRIGDWALIMSAGTLAANGETEGARLAFQMAADRVTGSSRYGGWSDARVLRSIGPYYFTPWAAAGFADDALQYAATLEQGAEAWAMVYIADGLAMRGDIDATKRVIKGMPGDFPMLGQIALAEAYRQAGDSTTALTLLDEAAYEFEFLTVGLRDWKAQRRLAIGYALLGDLEAAEYAMARAAYAEDMFDYYWRAVAPVVACYDFHKALGLITDRSGYRNQEATVEILVAAAASGHGEAAYEFAKEEDRLIRRLSYLGAVAIGLRHAEDAAPDAIPCATLNPMLSL